ncbi:MAG: hypothetical protein WCY19_08185 [Candidatus Gastranaerophilaceae bacterium]
MDSDEIIFRQYKVYTEQKEKFVDRSFATNKFYLFLVLGLVLTMFLTREFSFVFGLSSILIFSTVGIAICVFWWINIDSYNFLIKVKLAKVIEEIEKKLPVQPYTQEFLAIKDLRKNKREFLFADMQKVLATLALLLFFVLFSNEVLALIFQQRF